MTFTPGTPKPPNSGMRKGQKTRKTIMKEKVEDEFREEKAAKARAYRGMSAQEVLEAEDFDPLIEMIYMARNPHLENSVRQKVLDSIARKVLPDLKTVENKGDTGIRIVIEGLPPPPEPMTQIDADVKVTAIPEMPSTVLEQSLPNVDEAVEQAHTEQKSS